MDEVFEKEAVKLGESLKAVKSVKPKPRVEREDEDDVPRKGPRNTAVSFTQEEYEFLKEIFETKARGLKVATGIKIAALYVAERLDAGIISMSRAGIMERR
jgi:hypothetical protein